jgi:hypothetical protein
MAIVIAHHAAKGRDPTSAESAMGAASFVSLSRIIYHLRRAQLSTRNALRQFSG